MNTEAAMELQMRLAKEALAMLVIHPTFDVQLYRESIMEIGEAWELPADATLEALALIEHERLAIQKPERAALCSTFFRKKNCPCMLPARKHWIMYGICLKHPCALRARKGARFSTTWRGHWKKRRTCWTGLKNGGGKTGVTAPNQSDSIQPSRPTWGGSSFPPVFRRVSRCVRV